jgi:hypothetical protein
VVVAAVAATDRMKSRPYRMPHTNMSEEWIAAVAAAEATAQQKQVAEETAYERFNAARAEIEAAGRSAHVVDTPEFRHWMTTRRESDEAWGAWAMAMDAKPTS